MPINKYYKGKGAQVMSDMKERYGEKQGERAFYATANKRGLTPSGSSAPAKAKKMGKAGKY